MRLKSIFLASLAVMLVSLVASVGLWSSFTGGGHDFRGRCDFCHLQQPTGGEIGRFARDISFLCLECHSTAASNSHPIGVTPSMAVPELFPLDWSGRMTCVTCHDPHNDGSDAELNFMRTAARGKDFCDACHLGNLPLGGGQHVGSVGIAHSKTGIVDDRQNLSQVLDSISLECLTCHDGVIASDTSYKVTGGEAVTYQRRGLSHPIGMDYRKAALLDRELRPVEMISPLIALYDGKVGCASCHNPYSSQRRMLIMDNFGSALCLECHIK